MDSGAPNNMFFVLVRPQFLGNVGSSARVLKNFGFDKLRLVAPPKNYKDAEARKMSVGAFDVLKHAEVFDSLSDALADISLAIGTTSGKQREMPALPLPAVMDEIVRRLPSNQCAIVFGDEVNGLSRDDLLRCHHVATIPTNPDFPALNLSHAVAVACWEVFSRSSADNTPRAESAAEPSTAFSTGSGDDRLFEELEILLDRVEFSRTFNRSKVLAELRNFYQRAHPSAREADLLTGALIRLNQKINEVPPV